MSPLPSSATDLAARLSGSWTLADTSTVARFTVGNLVTKTVSGSMPITSASLTVCGDSSISVQVDADLAAIDTGHPRRDRDLRKPALLDLDRHPRLHFRADEIPAEGIRVVAEGWQVPGLLTVKGTTAEIVLDVEVQPAGAAGLRVRATGRVDRRDFGIKAPRFMIGAVVEFEVDVPFARS